MKKLLIIIGIILVFGIQGQKNEKKPTKVLVNEHKLPVEIKYHRVKTLLCKVPDGQRDEFVRLLKTFADERGFDWRFCLLVMFNESGLNPKTISGNYMGLVMFGNSARKILGVSKQELYEMNYVEQTKAAIKIWESSEKMMRTTIDGYFSLVMCNFLPAYMNYHHNSPLPVSEQIKKQNYPLLNKQGELTKESILNFSRKRVNLYKELKYFRGKF